MAALASLAASFMGGVRVCSNNGSPAETLSRAYTSSHICKSEKVGCVVVVVSEREGGLCGSGSGRVRGWVVW